MSDTEKSPGASMAEFVAKITATATAAKDAEIDYWKGVCERLVGRIKADINHEAAVAAFRSLTDWRNAVESWYEEDASANGECCDRCGRPYRTVWWASAELWERLVGKDNEGGLLCPPCFNAMCEDGGVTPCWRVMTLDQWDDYYNWPKEIERLKAELAAEQAEVKCLEEALAELDEHVMVQRVDAMKGDVKIGPGQAGTFTAIVRKNRSLAKDAAGLTCMVIKQDVEIVILKKQLAKSRLGVLRMKRRAHEAEEEVPRLDAAIEELRRQLAEAEAKGWQAAIQWLVDNDDIELDLWNAETRWAFAVAADGLRRMAEAEAKPITLAEARRRALAQMAETDRGRDEAAAAEAEEGGE